jgi:UDP-N-acetylmuramyl pentapeptide phosphotransferase/UDP-N-acetylglucosamine-1-phosphate transferase
LWCALFAAISAAGTWMARRYAVRRSLVDHPGERRSHSLPTPRGGGIAIAIAFSIAILAMAVRQPLQIVLLGCAGLGLLLIAAIGWLDDHRPLSPWLRLCVHAVAASLLAVGVALAGGSFALAGTGFVLALVLVNVWNFMDGIDGIAATQAALVGLVFVMVAGGSLAVALGLAFAAAIIGFLPFNMPRARIFLGDVGSGTLGYGVALMAVFALDRLAEPQWPLVLLPLSAFLLDAGLTLSTRIVRGERWWTPHVEHAYQRTARRFGRHWPVTIGYAVWTAIACIMFWRFRGHDAREITKMVLSWLALGACVWYWLRSRPSAGAPAQGGPA